MREVGAAIGVQINAQQQTQLQRTVRVLERPVLPPGHSPGQERVAAAFLKNTLEMNHADPRLAPAQAIVDAAMQTARDRGESARMVRTIGESTRQIVANQIKTGGVLDIELSHAAERRVALSAPAKDQSR